MEDTKVLETSETEEDEKVYELSEDEYMALVTGLKTYKEKFEQAEKALQDEKENVVDLLLKVEALEDRVNELEKCAK